MGLWHLPAPLILASTSKYRIAQLRRLAVEFSCVAPDYAELPVPGLSARALVAHHALQKTLSVQRLFPDALVLGADQGVVLDDALIGKPGTTPAAVAQLLQLQGRTHVLLTVVVLAQPGRAAQSLVSSTEVTVRPLTQAQAQAYVDQDQPLDCAGSYKIEAAGPWLFERLVGEDPTAIEGLPLIAVAELLRAAGA